MMNIKFMIKYFKIDYYFSMFDLVNLTG